MSLALLLPTAPVWAQTVQVENRLVSTGVPGDTGNGASTPSSLSSADGRYVVFASNAQSFVDGIVDLNNAQDVFLHDRVAQTTVLVSRSAASALVTANGFSSPAAISADGEWVLFSSQATNAVAGVTDSNGSNQDVFLYQRSTGAVSLVSRSVGSATVTANNFSEPTAISADGEWVLFRSVATNLVDGVTDSNGARDVFLYRRSTGAVSLVSRSAASATVTANSQSLSMAISADGEWVLFSSSASNLVTGVTDSNGTNMDVFLYRRSTGAVSLVSRSAASATVTANGTSTPTAISADGEWVLFYSSATNLVAGVTDSNGDQDVFLYQRSTGAVSLVSRSAGSETVTANSQSFPTAISADGEWVLLSSRATNLVTGVTDSNGTDLDAFLYQRSTGAVSLVSRSAGSETVTANSSSIPMAISADGEWVLFGSNATDVVAGVTDSNGTGDDVFLYQRSTGAVSLVSRSAGSATVTANSPSSPTAISADGEWVLFRSNASNVVAGVTDSNGFQDVFLHQRSTGAVSLVSRSAGSATVTANNSSIPTAISADGEWVLFSSQATNVVAGVTDSNGAAQDVFLYQHSTGEVSLVSRSAASATVTANSPSSPTAISADGEWVLFSSSATNVVPSVTDSNSAQDVFLYQRSTGAVSLVSRSAASALVTANGFSSSAAISADGEWVLFQSRATNLVAGVTDSNGTDDVFLYQRSTGAVSLVSRSAGSATVTANSFSTPRAISADGEWVLFSSGATNVVAGVTDSNGFQDALLYQRSTGAVSLVSRSAGSATVTANSQSSPTAISADGEWVLFRSNATDVVAGVTDSNGTGDDVFLYQRSTGAVSLVSRSAGSAMVTASGNSFPTAISADGEWVLFRSNATDVVAGVTDSNGTGDDVFLYQRSTGAVSLVSRSAGSAMVTASGNSFPTAISADGEWVLFRSNATDVVAGVTDSNGTGDDVFLYQRSTGAVSLVSRSAGLATVTANSGSTSRAISADGRRVLFDSSAADVVGGVLDGNGNQDIFLANVTVREAATASVTAATPDPSLVGQAVTIEVAVAGASTPPADGQIVVTASTGETCTDTTAAAGSGTSALFSCAITFNTVGPRTLTAAFSGSATHADSVSAAEPHGVVTSLTLAPSSLSGGTFGVAYSQTVSASGAGSAAPYSFAITSGALPTGVVLNAATGEISGTPTAAGAFNVEITATDSSGPGVGGPFTGSRAFLIEIARANQSPLTATASPSSIAFGGTSTLGTTGGSGTGAVSFAITAGGEFCSISGTTLTGTGVGTCTVRATKAADANFNAASATVEVTVGRAEQAALTATASPSSIAFGGTSTLGTTGGSGTGAVSFAVTVGGEFCSITGTTLTGTGVGTCTVTATKAADANFNAASAAVSVTVARANQAPLTATASPSSIAFGGTSTLATTGGSGTGAVSYAVTAGNEFCSTSGTTLTGTGVGTCTVTATKAADANFNAATATVEVTVGRAEQAALTATASPSSIAFGGTSTLGTTGGSGTGAVSYAVTAGTAFCSISGTTLTGTGVGTCTVTATKAADANFNAAPATVEVTVGRADQAPLTATATPASIVFNGTSALEATGGSGTGAVSFAVTAGTEFCSISGSALTGTGVGTCTVTATKEADGNFNAATATVDVTVGRADQAPLNATAIPASIVFNGTSTFATTGGSGTGAVSFAVTAGSEFCSISGTTLTGTGVGTCTVTATKAADANFNAATATVEVTVGRAEQAALTATASPSSIAFGGTSTLGTTGGSGTGAMSYAVTVGSEFCSISGTTLTGTGVGTCTVTATKAADDNFNAATATVEVTVGRADQAPLTATATPASIVFNGTSALEATGGSGTGAVSFAVTAGGEFCSISGTTLTGTGVGICTVTATKAADDNFNAATATVDVTVGRAEQAALTATASPSSIAFGATSTLATTGGSGTGAVSYAISAGSEFCSISGMTLTGAGVGTCTVTATKAADANFNEASATVDVTVVQADQAALTATASPSSIAFGGTSTLGTTGGSGTGAVSYAVTAGSDFCSISGTTLTGTGVGTCTVTATKAADDNFNAATATVDVTVGRADQAALTATASPSSIAFGGTSTLATTGGSGPGAVSYAVTAGGEFCSISGTTLTGTGVGTCTITATKAADANFNAAVATVDVAVGRAEQSALTATASPSSIAFGGTSTLGTTGGSGTGAVSFTVTGGGEFCSISGTTLTGIGVGTCTVTATKAADANFNAATATLSVTVGRAEQAALTATASPSSIAFGGTTTLATTGGSGTGAVSYAISAGSELCSISSTTLTGIGVGTCTVTATKASDDNFNAATATVSVTVARANQAPLSVTATPSAIPLTRTTALAAAGGSGSGEVSFAVTAGTSNCTISGSTLTGTGVGACTVVATKAGDAQFNPASAQATVEVQAATDLEISKDDGTQYALPQGTVLYEILVANAGPLDVEGARLRDVLPAGLADALWTCTPLQLASCPQAAGEGGIDQTLTLPVNGVLRYLLSARVTAPLGSTLNNTATIDAPTGVIELQPSDNSASDSNLVVPEGLFGNGFEAAPNRISVPVRAR